MSIPDLELEHRIASRLMDVLIRAGLIIVLVMLCYRIFAPFMSLMVWALILAVALYPLHQWLATAVGGRQGLGATLVVGIGLVVFVVPTAILTSSLGDSVQHLVTSIEHNTLKVPPPLEGIASWPLVGEQLHAAWHKAHTDLPALLHALQPKIGDIARAALGFVGGIGLGMLQFLASFVIAGIIMAYGTEGGSNMRAIFVRVAGQQRGAQFAVLATQTIRAVAQGILGVAVIQALIIGLCLLVAGIPWAGALAAIVLVLGIAQLPAALITLPAIAYLWMSGNYGTGMAALYSVLLFVGGMVDNVLKPLMLGRGVEAPMPVILIGALGGMAAAGIAGMFVGAVLLALGYQIFMGWVKADPDTTPDLPITESTPADTPPA